MSRRIGRMSIVIRVSSPESAGPPGYGFGINDIGFGPRPLEDPGVGPMRASPRPRASIVWLESDVPAWLVSVVALPPARAEIPASVRGVPGGGGAAGGGGGAGAAGPGSRE